MIAFCRVAGQAAAGVGGPASRPALSAARNRGADAAGRHRPNAGHTLLRPRRRGHHAPLGLCRRGGRPSSGNLEEIAAKTGLQAVKTLRRLAFYLQLPDITHRCNWNDTVFIVRPCWIYKFVTFIEALDRWQPLAVLQANAQRYVITPRKPDFRIRDLF